MGGALSQLSRGLDVMPSDEKADRGTFSDRLLPAQFANLLGRAVVGNLRGLILACNRFDGQDRIGIPEGQQVLVGYGNRSLLAAYGRGSAEVGCLRTSRRACARSDGDYCWADI